MSAEEKPPYRVPLMTEIRSLPWNGYKAISFFSGCGGSSLGYKMAGFKVLFASEFVPAAQETYRANHEGTILDTRDIRLVQAQEVLDAIQMQPGELDLLDGSPPCASFSTAGKREAGWGKVKNYSDTKQRTDDLFFEYVRMLQGIRPKVFVAENVSGLVKGTAKGYFLEILSALKGAGYNVSCRVLDAQWLGVPQQRQRTIFIGVREDLGVSPVHPEPLPYRYSVREAIPWVSKAVHDTAGQWAKDVDVTSRPCPAITVGVNSVNSNHFKVEIVHPSGFKKGVPDSVDAPMPTVMARPEGIGGMGPGQSFLSVGGEKRKFSIAELRRICGFPDDFILTGTYAQQWERLGRAVPPVMMYHVARVIRDQVLPKCG